METTENTAQLPIQRPITNNNATRSNRNLVRSGSTRRGRKSQKASLLNEFEGLKAIHYVGEVGGRTHDARVYEGEGNQVNQDGIFRYFIRCFASFSNSIRKIILLQNL